MHDPFPILFAGAPPDRPLAAVCARRLGIIAHPAATFRVDRSAGRVTSRWLVAGADSPPPVPLSHDPLTDLAALLAWGRAAAPPPRTAAGPFAGGWIGAFSYDLGRLIEPAVERGRAHARDDRAGWWPLIELHWCPSATVIHRRTGEVSHTSEPPAPAAPPPPGAPFHLGPLASGTGQAAFEHAVARAIEYIRAGDIFQANLAHRLTAPFAGSARALFAALCAAADPWHGAYVEVPRCRSAGVSNEDSPLAIASASPELFLRVEPLASGGSRVVTRPMKGTRPASAAPAELDASEKDRAELTMIIDLMRNDLGRLARTGSVRVESPREIERHGPGQGGVLQAVATVSAELPPGRGLADLLRAAFPPGSVTGAPKIRAMQIIDELEPIRRGPYCGALGWISTTGHAELAVAIRTALISGEPADTPGRTPRGRLDYSVGAGIVADSDPAAEWQETLDKAGILRAIGDRATPRATGLAATRAPGAP